MAKTWILVAHRSGARLLENTGPGKGLKLVQAIEHPAGKLKNHDINSDKPGRSFDSRGAGRHAYTKEHEPVDHLAEQFAKRLVTILDEGRMMQRYDRLILVAEPRFLGRVRAALNPHIAALITASLDKDLGEIDTRDLPKHLNNTMVV